MGGAVNLAARLRNHAGPSQILVSGATYRRAQGIFDYAGLDLTVPGLDRAVTAYQVLRFRRHITKVPRDRGAASRTGRP